MDENEVATAILDASFRIHRRLGPGLLESVYEAILAHELRKRGYRVRTQVAVPLTWDGVAVGEAFRVDLIVEERVLVELKSTERSNPVHKKQVITYLKITGLRLALLINFGAQILRDGVERIVHRL